MTNFCRCLILAVTLLPTALMASGSYKNTSTYENPDAWYVGVWSGSNLAFDPALQVEITITPGGNVYAYSHGAGRSYKVSTHGKQIKIRHLKDTPMRGKMRNDHTMILEDGGKLKIAKQGDRLQTTVEKLGIVVLYERVLDERQLGAIEARVEQQKDSEAHHKDEDFWHSPEFWGAVIGAAAVESHEHQDTVVLKNVPTISQKDADALVREYSK